MGISPQPKSKPDNINSIRNHTTQEESIDELTKKLEDVALERTIRQEDGSRPSSGESLDSINPVVIDLDYTNDNVLKQGIRTS